MDESRIDEDEMLFEETLSEWFDIRCEEFAEELTKLTHKYGIVIIKCCEDPCCPKLQSVIENSVDFFDHRYRYRVGGFGLECIGRENS